CHDTINMNVDVVNVQPLATFNFSNAPCTGDCVFNNQSQWSTNFDWNFGDNNTSTSANPFHTYQQPGSYTVTMIAYDNNGCADTVSQNVNIAPLPNASFISGVPPCSLTGTFTNASSSNVVSYRWDFGDGDSSTAQNPSHTYLQSGTFPVTLIVTDNNGCTDTSVQSVSPFVFSQAEFSYSIDTCATQIMFVNNSLNAETVLWDFGDGTTGSDFSPEHTYTQGITYPVVLVTNPGSGCADTMATNINY